MEQLTLTAKEATCIYQAFQINVECMLDKSIPYGELTDYNKTFLGIYLKTAKFINGPRFVKEVEEALNAGRI